MSDHILLTGIPGTGKTTIGNYLQQNYGFIHDDFEIMDTLSQFDRDKSGFVTRALAQEKVIITWGFVPDWHTEHVIEMKRRGFTLIWFDGDRVAAFREFMKRGDVPDSAFYIQLNNICSSKVIEIVQPKIINPFGADRQFRQKEDITKEIMAL
jgi:adenylate kinase family enzyme